MLCGRWARGLTHFVMIGMTFAFGVALHSHVLWPVWSIRSEDFNLISNFTFVVQMGSGLFALSSFMASVSAEAGSTGVSKLAMHAYFELGSYFLIVAGALNYFAVGNFYDRHVRPQPRFIEHRGAPDEGHA